MLKSCGGLHLHDAHSVETHQVHDDFELLRDSWLLALDSDGYSRATMVSYGSALTALVDFLGPGVAPSDVTRDDVRRWLIAERDGRSSSTARSRFAGVRHFFRWMVAEDERSDDPTEGIRTPAPNDPTTPVLSEDELRKLVDVCEGDEAIPVRRHATASGC